MKSRALSAIFVIALAATPASAGDFMDWCMASTPGADSAKREQTCKCLAEATEGDVDARTSMEQAADIADREARFAALSEEAKAAVASCRPTSG
jgi:hypothetical protein